MGGCLSKLPLRLEADADYVGNIHNFPSSVHKVLSNDDLLTEILLRLPTFEHHLFKRVCKQWLSLIKSHSFTLTRSGISTVDPPSGLFISRCTSDKYDYDFVSFDPRIPAKRSIHSLVYLGGWNIEQSCNGLLLCNIGCNKYYVCNTSISMFKVLPPKHDLNYVRNGYERIYFAFDPTKSPYYKVIHYGRVNHLISNGRHWGGPIRIQTYSSEIGVWSVSDDKFPSEFFTDFSNGIYWNGAIHWLRYNDVIKLSIVDNPVLTKMQTPLPLTVKGRVHYDRKLYKSDHGSLLLLCKNLDRTGHLKIYEMKKGYYVWSVKYFVNLDDVMRPYPTWRMPTNWRCRDMLSIVFGERDEDSFFVIELSGKILQYKFGLETVRELFDLGKANSIRGSFEYIASFAHV